MRNGLILTWSVLFLCTFGWVCTDSAIGADEPVSEASETKATADEGIFTEADSSADDALPEGQEVTMGTFGEIDLHIKDLELANVLQTPEHSVAAQHRCQQERLGHHHG